MLICCRWLSRVVCSAECVSSSRLMWVRFCAWFCAFQVLVHFSSCCLSVRWKSVSGLLSLFSEVASLRMSIVCCSSSEESFVWIWFNLSMVVFSCASFELGVGCDPLVLSISVLFSSVCGIYVFESCVVALCRGEDCVEMLLVLWFCWRSGLSALSII